MAGKVIVVGSSAEVILADGGSENGPRLVRAQRVARKPAMKWHKQHYGGNFLCGRRICRTIKRPTWQRGQSGGVSTMRPEDEGAAVTSLGLVAI